MEVPESPEDMQALVAGWFGAHAEAIAPFKEHEPFSYEEMIQKDALLQRLLWDGGLTRIGWPTEVGGLGGPAMLRAALYEGMGVAGIRIPEAITLAEILVPAMTRFAPTLAPHQVASFLNGDHLWAQGFSEPEAGSDLGSLRLKAVDGGDHFVLNGQKIWTSTGQCATHYFVICRTGTQESAHRGLTMLFVDRNTPGIEARPIRCASDRNNLAEVFFDDVVVPKSCLIGGVGQGWAVAMYLLQFERGMYAWQRQSWLHGRLTALLESLDVDALPPGASARIGETYEAVFSLRVRCAETVRRLSRGESPGPEISIDKVLLSAAEQAVFDLARELLTPAFELDNGAADPSWRWEWWYSRPASVYGGAGEVQRNIIAERILGLPR